MPQTSSRGDSMLNFACMSAATTSMTSRKRRRVIRSSYLVQGQVGGDQGHPRKIVRQHHHRHRVTAKSGNEFGMSTERMPSVGDHGFTDRVRSPWRRIALRCKPGPHAR